MEGPGIGKALLREQENIYSVRCSGLPDVR
jgi:hypothetical protein